MVFRMGIVILVLCSALWRCARQMAPQGGPKDSLPPRVVVLNPEYGMKNFTAKRIIVEFDEYVQLKDQQKEFYTSPWMEKPPLVTLRGRGFIIDIKDSLKPNTTYAFNFGSCVEDNNEGNPLNDFRYVFSTGTTIDSMVMSGYTADAYKGDSVSKCFIFFYPAQADSVAAYDSTMFWSKPSVIARSQSNGMFIAQNLKPAPYRVYAMEDRNGNKTYEPGVDRVAFLDSVYNPQDMPGFGIHFDTMRKYLVPDPQLYFRMFMDKSFKRQLLASTARPGQHKAVLSFAAPYPEIRSMHLDGIDSTHIITEYLKPERDSIALWFDLPKEELPDSIRGTITYMRHDSLSRLEEVTDSLKLNWRLFEKKKTEREKEREKKRLEKEKPENPFKFQSEASSALNPLKDIPLTFDYPLTAIDSQRISLIRVGEEDKLYRVRFKFDRDTSNIRRWILSAPWSPGQKYRLVIPDSVFRNVAGEYNDTIRTEFTVNSPDKFATLNLKIKGKTPGSRYVLQLMGAGEKVAQEIPHAGDGEYTFQYVDIGTASIRVVEDINDNGKWDPGNLVERRQPERVEYYVPESGEKEIITKMNWTIDLTLDMNLIFAPVTMGMLIERLRAEELALQRKRQKEMLEREKERKSRGVHGEFDNEESQGSNPFGGQGGGGMMPAGMPNFR